MSSVARAMAVLQFGDSFFPSGSVSFSWGLEDLSDRGVVGTPDLVQAFVLGQLRARWANFDRPALIAAHRASGCPGEVSAIDDLVEVQTPSAELRQASRRMGEATLSVFARMGFECAQDYRKVIRMGTAYGHLPVMQGYLWGTAGLDQAEAVALSAHTFSTGLLGAAIRLGCMTHIDAQRTLTAARELAGELAQMPVPAVSELNSYGVEAEIAVMRHASNKLRVFAN